MKELSAIVEYCYKYNLFTIIIKIKLKISIIILRYYYSSVDTPFSNNNKLLRDAFEFTDTESESES